MTDFAQAFQQAIRHQSQQTGSDIRTTLTISREEALNGTTHTLNLPGGRKVSVSVPAGTIDGQAIRLTGEGDGSLNGGPRGSLILTIAVASQNTGSATLLPGNNEETVRGHSGIQSKSSVISENPLKDTDPSRRGSGPTSVPTTEPPITPVQSIVPPTVSSFPSTDPKAGELPPTIPVKPPPPPPDAAKSSADQAEVTAPPPPPPEKPKPDRARLLLVALATIIIIASIAGFGAYQNHANQVNAQATVDANNATAMASDATSTAVVIANATGTAQAIAGTTATVIAQNPYPSYLSGSGTLALYDPLSSPSSWSSSSDSSFGGACQFSNGALHITQAPPNKLYPCNASSTSFSNFAFEVQMNIIAGDCGGIGFRNDGSNGKVYFFEVCQNGSYTLHRYTDNTHQTPLTNNSSSAISTGLNQSNTIAVLASGSTIELYVNQQKIGSVNDSTYSTGTIGLIASAYSNQAEVAYTNARVWTL